VKPQIVVEDGYHIIGWKNFNVGFGPGEDMKHAWHVEFGGKLFRFACEVVARKPIGDFTPAGFEAVAEHARPHRCLSNGGDRRNIHHILSLLTDDPI
jgi:hypothetical protein